MEKVVLVTGAKGGLGLFVSRGFLDTGATVIGSSRSIQVSDLAHPRFIPMPADFANAAEAEALADQVIKQFGRLDVLVHVMGGYAGGSSVADTDDRTWEQMYTLNLASAFHAVRAVLSHMRRANSGRIIAVGSLAATEPHAGLGAYVVFKRALATLIETVALENADKNISANVVLPGTMDTPANRAAMPNANFSQWVSPDKVARLIVWLANEQSSIVNGALIPIQD
jgi:NAD(P)-dependent dehydrogenase (short-subunit alcohol dehydrogenase family)